MIRIGRAFSAIFFFSIFLSACSGSPKKEHAVAWLTAPQKWYLKEVTVNGKPVFKDGEAIEQFGEVTFSRYMEEVSFSPDGKFSGTFKNDKREFTFSWTAAETELTVSDTIPGSGKWSIPYRTLKKDSFEMQTETTAFDPPNLTKINLRFGI